VSLQPTDRNQAEDRLLAVLEGDYRANPDGSAIASGYGYER
jgi:hypothetical protein